MFALSQGCLPEEAMGRNKKEISPKEQTNKCNST
jgi:hypothetical protein